ncbi:MAG TPA: toll/interleukin-1 receptor domain-containing protein, partial [Azonexus sp.]|nr:toll/interleukin-1 receptor domain-containing protein [Azonexus sp.]
MTGIFISYRRDDSPGFAGRLAEALDTAFGADNVFRDIDDIRPGEDFVKAIHNRLQAVDVLLAVIGPDWLGASKNGRRRLDDPDDFVRIEIQLALAAGKPVWPVLIGGAVMPVESDLPEAIRALARHQAIVLADASWKNDVARLITALRQLGSARPPSHRLRWVVGVGLVLLLGALFLAKPWAPHSLPAASDGAGQIASSLSGRWTARIHYDWGAEHNEAFDLQVEEGEVRGTASYLGLPRIVEQGRLTAGGQLDFVTHTESMAGETVRLLTHRYRGR